MRFSFSVYVTVSFVDSFLHYFSFEYSTSFNMSQTEEDIDVKVEIQKLLKRINDDMNNLKTELSTLNTLIEKDASLPITAKMVNEKLVMDAKNAGINLETIGDIININDLDEEDAKTNADADQSNDEPELSVSHTAAAVATVTKQLGKTVKKAVK